MLIARRLYVYFIAAVSLGMTVVGLENLLGLAFARIGEALGGSVIQQSSESVRQQLSVFAALVIVALPVWLLHWWLAERALHRPGPEGEHERASEIRALYLTLVLAVPLQGLVFGAVDVLSWLFNRVFGGTTTIGSVSDLWISLAIILVSGAVIAYHGRIRLHDTQAGPLEGAAAWLPRLYLYVATIVGAILLLFGLADLIRVLNDSVFGANQIVFGQRWWAEPLSSAIARTLVGLAVWGLYWEFSLRTLRRTDWLGASERRSSLRWFYIYVVVFISVLFTLRGVSSSLDVLLQWTLNVPRGASQLSWTRAILEPLFVAVPFAGFWAYHRLVVLGATPEHEATSQVDSLRRLYTYLVAFVGLAFTAVGAAYVLGIVIDLVLGGTRTVSVSSVFWRDDVAQFGSFALVGAAAWLWQWYGIERRLVDHQEIERGATTRRIYLYLTLAASLVAILVSLAIVVYRVFSAILGVNTGASLASAISVALGVVIVAAALLGYHFTVLRNDLAHREEVAPGALTISLTLTTPAGADIAATVSELRAHLPEGYALEFAGSAHRQTNLPALTREPDGDDAETPIVSVP